MKKTLVFASLLALVAGSLLACDGMTGSKDHASLSTKKTCVMAKGKICKTKVDKNEAALTVKKAKI